MTTRTYVPTSVDDPAVDPAPMFLAADDPDAGVYGVRLGCRRCGWFRYLPSWIEEESATVEHYYEAHDPADLAADLDAENERNRKATTKSCGARSGVAVCRLRAGHPGTHEGYHAEEWRS